VFVPVGDSPNPLGTPWVNYGLIATNIAVYVLLLPLSREPADPSNPALHEYVQAIARERHLSPPEEDALTRQVSRYDLVVFDYGVRPAHLSLVDLFTAMFLHGGFLHLAGNMLFLWIYGDNVEFRLGRFGYVLAYLATGVAAGLGDVALRSGSAIPSIGASGAISGVLGLYFIWFPRNAIRVWVFLMPLFAQAIELPARIVLGVYLLLDNILPLIMTAADGGVSYGAHIGGFAAGCAAAVALDRLSLARPERDVRPAHGAGAPAQEFRAALAAQRWQEAAEWFFNNPHSVTRRGVDAVEKIGLGEQLEQAAHPRAALAMFQRALADHPGGPGRARAHLGAARVLMNDLHIPAAAYQHLNAALEEDPEPRDTAAARALLQQLATQVRRVPAKAWN
jgi:membrane associated rhomboid family serine protease